MNGHGNRAPKFSWDFLSDAVGALSLCVLLLGALGLPHLF